MPDVFVHVVYTRVPQTVHFATVSHTTNPCEKALLHCFTHFLSMLALECADAMQILKAFLTIAYLFFVAAGDVVGWW